MAEQNNFVKDPFKENPIKQMLLSTPAAGESLGVTETPMGVPQSQWLGFFFNIFKVRLLIIVFFNQVRKGEQLYQQWAMIKSRLGIPSDLKTGVILLKAIHMLGHHYAELL